MPHVNPLVLLFVIYPIIPAALAGGVLFIFTRNRNKRLSKHTRKFVHSGTISTDMSKLNTLINKKKISHSVFYILFVYAAGILFQLEYILKTLSTVDFLFLSLMFALFVFSISNYFLGYTFVYRKKLVFCSIGTFFTIKSVPYREIKEVKLFSFPFAIKVHEALKITLINSKSFCIPTFGHGVDVAKRIKSLT